jgi:hypothetical protein
MWNRWPTLLPYAGEAILCERDVFGTVAIERYGEPLPRLDGEREKFSNKPS